MSAAGDTANLISEYLRLLQQPLAAPEVAAYPLSTDLPAHDPSRPCALLLSPHPDDECLTGALPLRLKQEQGWQIVNIAVTLGSKLERRMGRKAELAKACAVLGIDCTLLAPEGFSNINPEARAADVEVWLQQVARLVEAIRHYQPQAIFLPHALDWNATHVGTHFLGMDALAQMPRDFSCAVIQTEYWQPMEAPNLMIGVGEKDAATLLSALTCHVEEVARNPYDLRFPSYLIDNVRRGSERLSGKGAAAAKMDFAMMYCFGLWRSGKFMPSALKRPIGAGESVGILFE